MKVISHYNRIRGENFTLNANEEEDFTDTFKLPLDAMIDGEEGNSVLLYKSIPNNAKSIQYEIRVNTKVVEEGGFSDDHSRCRHTSVKKDVLKHNGNTINFKLTGGSGTVKFSDIILFYNRRLK